VGSARDGAGRSRPFPSRNRGVSLGSLHEGALGFGASPPWASGPVEVVDPSGGQEPSEQPPGILLGLRDPHGAAGAGIAAREAGEGAQQRVDVNGVGLGAAGAPVHPQAGGPDPHVRQPLLCPQTAVQPEPVAARLVAGQHRDQVPAPLLLLGAAARDQGMAVGRRRWRGAFACPCGRRTGCARRRSSSPDSVHGDQDGVGNHRGHVLRGLAAIIGPAPAPGRFEPGRSVSARAAKPAA
jgi:hypothetical protein